MYSDITEPVKKRLKVFDPSFETSHENDSKWLIEIISQIKERLSLCETFDQKCYVLSVLPRSWTIQQIINHVGVTRALAEATKKLVTEKGVLQMPPPRVRSSPIDSNALKTMNEFYNSDEISRLMPGMKDCITIKADDEKKKVRIYQVLKNNFSLHSMCVFIFFI